MFKSQRGLWLLTVALLLGLGLMALQSSAASALPENMVVVKHKVTPGQNLWVIARQYGVTVNEIARTNNLKNPDRLLVGQILKIKIPNNSAYPKDITPAEVQLLAKVIYAEARGEDFDGQVAVGAVVLNRLKHPQFPKTLQGVIFQPGAFTAVQDKQIRLQPGETALKAAQAALHGADPTGGAIFYYNPSLASDQWIRTRPVLKVIGNHTFSS